MRLGKETTNMSMIGTFAAATDEEIASLVRNPHRITAFLREKDGASAAERRIDVRKAWHAIHFLLTGEPWAGEMPLGFIIAGGVQIGDVDVGYGPARAFTSGDVRNIDVALSTIQSSGPHGALGCRPHPRSRPLWRQCG